METLIGFFTGSGSVWKIVCAGLGVAFLTLSIYSGVKIGSLHVENATQKSEHEQAIKTLKAEHKEVIEVLEKKLTKLQKEKEDLQDKVSKVEAFSAQERADAERNAKLGEKKLQEVARAYKERMKRFEEKVKGVQDYGKSDSSIVDAAGI